MIDLWVNQAVSLSAGQAGLLFVLSVIMIAGIVFAMKGDSNVQP